MPVPEHILTDAWARVEQYLATLDDVEASYLADHGKYAQGLLTHSQRPADGNEKAPDRLGSHPSDQAHSWEDLVPPGTLPERWMSGLGIDVHETPQGWEYTVRSEIIVAGTLYRKERRKYVDGTTTITDWQEVA